MYILVAILIFGILITVHELGHCLAAKAAGARVNEFAVGMGPAILKKQGKETLYSLRLLPIGGFCAIEGEDGTSQDEGSMATKPLWKRLIILFSGSLMNFITGFLIVLIIFSTGKYYSTPVISGFSPDFHMSNQRFFRFSVRLLFIPLVF